MSKALVSTRKFATGIVGSLMLMAGQPALAWDGVATGTIQSISVTQGHNYAFRVYLNGTTTTCSSGENWTYLNEADSNYKTYVSVLMMAEAQGSSVTIYSNVENGYCHIGYITVS